MNTSSKPTGSTSTDASILLVEDSELIAVALSERLRKAGYRVDVRKNSREVISYVEMSKPDLILMDIELAGSRLNGIETMKTLRRKYKIPALYLTALDEDKFFEQAKETDPFAYINKSCDWITLKNQIEMALYRDKIEKEQRRLAEERNMLLSILETNIDEIYLFDFKTLKIQYANSGAAHKTGLEIVELKEKTIDEVNLNLDSNSVLEKMQELIRGGDNALHFTGAHKRVDGLTYPVECRLRLVEQGKSYSMLLVAFDITERERALKQMLEEERKRLEIEFSQRSIDKVCNVKKFFFENVSHSFRTPLNAVLGYSEILKQKLGAADAEVNSFLNGIIEGGSKLLELVDNIIDESNLHCDTFDNLNVTRLAPKPSDNSSLETGLIYKFKPAEVLVVDDSELNRRIISAMLTRAGLTPITVSSGKEAIALAESRPIAAIILDLNMPGMSGLETTRAIKSSPKLLRIPIIALSGMKFGEEVEALDKIAESRLIKPVSYEKLTQELSKYLAHNVEKKDENSPILIGDAPKVERDAIRERFSAKAKELTEGLSMDGVKELAVAIEEFSRSINSRAGVEFASRLTRAIDFYKVGEVLKMLETLASL